MNKNIFGHGSGDSSGPAIPNRELPQIPTLFKLSSGVGYFGEAREHIITYDPSKMPLYSAPFTFLKYSTFFGRRKFVYRHLGFTFATFIVALCFAFSPGGPEVGNTILPIFSDGVLQFRTLTSFIVGGYVLTVVARWYERRTNYASLCGAVRSSCVNISSRLPHASVSNNDLREIRKTLGRWVLLVHEIAVLKARDSMDAESAKEFLLLNNFAIEGEWEAMLPGDRHTSVIFWIMTYLKQLQREKYMNENDLNALENVITNLRSQANDLMSSLNRDVPFAYSQAVIFLVYINVFFLCGNDALVLSTHDGGAAPPAAWVFQLFCNLALCTCYGALVEVSAILNNPFGPRMIDAPHETISDGLRKVANDLLGDSTKFMPQYLKQKVLTQ